MSQPNVIVFSASDVSKVPMMDDANIFTTYQTFNGVRLNVATKTDSYTATITDDVIICNKGTAMTITLPAATGTEQVFHIKSIGAGLVTIDANASETIDGETTQVINQYDSISIIDRASGLWSII
jgi:hypothetical protein